MTKPSDGYFFAKREMVEAIDRRIEKNQKEYDALPKISSWHGHRLVLKSKIQALEETRNYVRNVMLWDTRKGD